MTRNHAGTTGWGKVRRSSNPTCQPGKVLKIHLCGNNPCQAHWSDARYGLSGPPVHMQAITCMGPAAAPLPSLKAAAPASPKDVEEDTAIAEAATAKATAVAAAAPAEEEQLAVQAKVRAAVLSLAR